jgi:hypothetical protein
MTVENGNMSDFKEETSLLPSYWVMDEINVFCASY